jgi:hypothetical protein
MDEQKDNPVNEEEPTQASDDSPQWQYQSGQLAPSIGYDQPLNETTSITPKEPVQAQDTSVANSQASKPLTTQSPPNAVPAASENPSNAQQAGDTVTWSAHEFLAHDKTNGWYLIFAVALLVLIAIIYVVTRDIFSVVIVAVLAAVFGVAAAIRPRVIDYEVSPGGLKVGNKKYKFDEFRSFSVFEDSTQPFIQLLPHKRFMVPLALHYQPADGERIITILGEYLASEQHKNDWVDKMTSRIHF